MGDGRSQFQFEREMEVSECQAELLDRLVPGAALDLVGRGISRHLHEYEPLLCANDVSLNSIFHSATHLRGDGLRTRMSISLVRQDRKSTRLNSSHANISYVVFCLKKKKK